jgi:formate dehydrogenase major subunit
MIHKLARAGAKTNNVGSFHYMGRGEGYRSNCDYNVPFNQIAGASAIYLVGTEINMDHAVAGFLVSNAQFLKKIPVISVTTLTDSSMSHKVTEQLLVKSYYHFIKAVNHYLLSNTLENGLFLRDRVQGFEGYKDMLLKEDFNDLIEKSGVTADQIAGFARSYNLEMNAVLIFSEKYVSANTSKELFNLAKITGKLGKTASGIIALKEKNNAQGIFDMGVTPHAGIGGQELADVSYTTKIKNKWQTSAIAPAETECLNGLFKDGKLTNLFIFGEDPVGCAINREEILRPLKKASFVVVQDYFLTDTAREADLIMPASFPGEIGGTFTNSQKVIQPFGKSGHNPLKECSLTQICNILGLFNVHSKDIADDIMMEIATLLPLNQENEKLLVLPTKGDNNARIFDHGADYLVKQFNELFNAKIQTQR